MKGIEVLAYLFIAFLLVASSQSQFSISIRTIQAMETVDEDTKIITSKRKPNSANRFLLATWEEAGTKLNDNMRKVPSAPNPIGNRHPPSKPRI